MFKQKQASVRQVNKREFSLLEGNFVFQTENFHRSSFEKKERNPFTIIPLKVKQP